MAEKTCSNCIYYQSNPGICRGDFPTPMLVQADDGGMEVQSFFAPMMPDGWCGRHVPRPDGGSVEIVVPTGSMTAKSH